MKRTLIISLVAAAGMSFLAGCTTTTTTAQNDPTKPVYTTEKKVYPKEELDKRGRQTPGEDLAAQDPEITYTGRH
ncbi:MAG: hypothetical protein M3032_02730 [Verrucomicrobiota bacterium]|nr:hypothetical protein [Verrucomicrobiota bacterium]